MSVEETAADSVAPTGGSSAARALVGTQLGSYRIERLLGEGAMGEVFLATHVALGRPVAIKTLKPHVASDRSLTERFFAEARAVNIIRHENIVECTDLVNDPDGRSYIVMELLEGKTLGAAITEVGRMPARRVARIAAQIADAIGAAHDKGIVHRDLKPENVYLIKRAGSPDYVKVLDFGIARLRPDLGGVAATQSGALIGTPAFMSPEQVRGEKAGPPADIYALATMVFQMLTGRLPFGAVSMSMMLVAQLQETPPRIDSLVADVPPAMADLVARALAKDPAARPKDMATFRRALLDTAGLPVDPHGSLVEAMSPVAMPAVASGLEPTLAPTSSDVRAVRPADSAIGHSSLSAAAGQVSGPRPSRALWFVAGGIGAVIVVGAIVAMVLAQDRKAPATTSSTTRISSQQVAIVLDPPSTTDPDALRDWDAIVNAVTTQKFAKARDLLQKWELRYGPSPESSSALAQLAGLPEDLIGKPEAPPTTPAPVSVPPAAGSDAGNSRASDNRDDPVAGVMIQFHSQPSGADVHTATPADRPLRFVCKTPCTQAVQRPRAGNQRRFVVTRAQHQPQLVVVDLSKAQRVYEVTLQRVPTTGPPLAKGAAVFRSPVWAKVFIDGKYVGDTPLRRDIEVGKHEVKAETAAGDTAFLLIEVEAGKAAVHTFGFKAPPPARPAPPGN